MAKIKIDNSKLKKASFHATLEANRWMQVADTINEKLTLQRELCVIIAYASEIYLKSILMYNGINVTTEKITNGHDLLELYNLLPINIKSNIQNNYQIEPLAIYDADGNIEKEFLTFEDILKEVSNYFFDLRYGYEKFVTGESIKTVKEFIIIVNNEFRDIAEKQIYI